MRLSRHVTSVLARHRSLNGVAEPRAGYVVFAGSYVSNSAGIACLHRLCHELNARGYPAFATGGQIAAPSLDAPMISVDVAKYLCSQGFIAVYPETIAGNPFHADTVIRWVLNRPGLLGGDEVYAQSELVFSYSEVFTPYIRNPIAGKLYMPTIDESIFFRDDSCHVPRSLECFYVGKSQWKEGIVNPDIAFEITRDSPNKSELGKIFRAAKVLYCFDNSSIIIYEALLCGCPVVVVPDGTQTRADYEQLELGTTGICWGADEFQDSSFDPAPAFARYEAVKRDYQVQLKELMETSQCHSAKAVEWEHLTFEANPSGLASYLLKASTNGARHLNSYIRAGERSIRRVRKRYTSSLRKYLAGETECAINNSVHLACVDSSNAIHRNLECCCESALRYLSLSMRNRAVAIPATMSSTRAAKLLRVSTRYYTSKHRDPRIELAARCGCQVSIVGKSGKITEYFTPVSERPTIGNQWPAVIERVA